MALVSRETSRDGTERSDAEVYADQMLTLLAGVRDIQLRIGAIESTLERYRPLLDVAEQRLNGPRFFGRGAQRAPDQSER